MFTSFTGFSVTYDTESLLEGERSSSMGTIWSLPLSAGQIESQQLHNSGMAFKQAVGPVVQTDSLNLGKYISSAESRGQKWF